MFEKQSNNKQYTSCIKINGVPILPPLVTPSMKKELQHYKSEAVSIEKYLERIRKLKISKLPKKVSLSTKDSLLFEDTHSHIDALDITSPISCDFKDNTVISTKKKRKPNLTKNLIDVCEYTGVYNIKENDEKKLLSLNENSAASSHNNSIISNDSPRLLRSDSYTLLNPSPMLLAHLERHGKNDKTQFHLLDETFDQNEFPENYLVEENKTIVHNDIPKVVLTEPCYVSNQSTFDTELQNMLKNNFENDFFNDFSELDIDTTSTPLSCLDTNKLIQEIDKTLKNCSEGCEELLEPFVEKDEYKSELNCGSSTALEAARKSIIEDSVKSNSLINKTPTILNYDNETVSAGSVMSSQSIYYSLTASLESISSPTIAKQRVEFTDFNKNIETISSCKSETTFSNQLKNVLKETYSPSGNCNKQLFPEGHTTKAKMTEARAAEIICASVKGFLTRRLMRTEKVQNLIQTIKDALLCAIQLHGADQIDESDVELHRRLIQQVSAACYAFHDVFFSLTITEQMNLIATDRKRKIEKAKRPLSSGSSQLLLSDRSSKSSTSLEKRSISGRMTQSLTNF